MTSKKSPTPPASEDLADAFFSVFHGLRRAVDRRFQHTPYSMARLRVLFQLIDQQEAMRMGELSTCIEVAPRTMTSTIEAMERDGLVRRSPDPADGRAIIVTITDKGRDAYDEGRHLKNSVVADLFETLDADQRTALAEILTRLDEAVDKANSAPAVAV